MTAAFASRDYWEHRYQAGGDSGPGSMGRLARFKAAVINQFVAVNGIQSVIDLGCGDGSQLALLELPANYIGVDVAQTALARCVRRFPHRRFVTPDQLEMLPAAELALSIDVLFHLVEDAVFDAALGHLFRCAARFVVIYASNTDASWPAAHVRHRRFTDRIAASQSNWRLVAHLPNPWPYDPALPNDTSFADFFIYARREAACSIILPPVA